MQRVAIGAGDRFRHDGHAQPVHGKLGKEVWVARLERDSWLNADASASPVYDCAHASAPGQSDERFIPL
jgi:hypothetical protein